MRKAVALTLYVLAWSYLNEGWDYWAVIAITLWWHRFGWQALKDMPWNHPRHWIGYGPSLPEHAWRRDRTEMGQPLL
jgi:hypothetical protein